MATDDDVSNDIGSGVAMTFGLHLAAVFVCLVLAFVGVWWLLIALLAIGVTQLVYMVPSILIARDRGRPELAKGLMIGAVITFLLSGACWVAVWGNSIIRLAG